MDNRLYFMKTSIIFVVLHWNYCNKISFSSKLLNRIYCTIFYLLTPLCSGVVFIYCLWSNQPLRQRWVCKNRLHISNTPAFNNSVITSANSKINKRSVMKKNGRACILAMLLTQNYD